MQSAIGDARLVEEIKLRIRNDPHRAIRFKEYMELCLYHDTYGYYRTERPKVGKNGDFYTSSSIGTIMGEMLAEYIVRHAGAVKTQCDPLYLVEFGGGSGRLARHVMDAIQSRGVQLYNSIQLVMIETSGYHRSLQLQELAEHAAQTVWMTEEEWLHEGVSEGVVALANELLDAFPVYLLEGGVDGAVQEIWVTWDESGGQFREMKLPLVHPNVQAYLETEQIHLLPGQRAEVNLDAEDWVTRVCRKLKRGKLLVIDYGDRAQELYAPHRMRGTLLGYRRHAAAERPYEHVGEQDLTAHVNFSSCMRSGVAAGCAAELMAQREFLLQQGVLTLLQDVAGADPFGPAAKRNRAVRQLLLSDQMSELFKVLILTKNEQ